MTALNNNLLIVGGGNKSFKTTDQILALDATGHLSNYTKMITARSLSTVAAYQGVLIITGGKDNKGIKLHWLLLKCLTVALNNGTLVETNHHLTTGYIQ